MYQYRDPKWQVSTPENSVNPHARLPGLDIDKLDDQFNVHRDVTPLQAPGSDADVENKEKRAPGAVEQLDDSDDADNPDESDDEEAEKSARHHAVSE